MSQTVDHVRSDCEDGILQLVLDRPEKLNALTPAMVQALRRGFERARESDVRVVVLRGTGRAFCAGADVEQALGIADPAKAYEFLAGLADVLAAMSSLPKPVIAAIQGHAVGGGAELALEADLRLASDDALISFPDVALGSTPATAYQLLRLVGKSLATRMVLLGQPLNAEDMKRLELVVETTTPDDLQLAAVSLAARLRDRASRLSLAFGKEAISTAERADRATDLRANVAAMLACQTRGAHRAYVAGFSARGR